MNTHKVKCVIDSDGYFVCVVLFTEHQTGKDEIIDVPYAYTLKDGESYINASVPVGCIKPRWNGTNWDETGKPTQEMIENTRKNKLNEVNAACQSAIYAGITVETSEGVKKFSLTEHDQIELSGLAVQVKDGSISAVPYHADGELCRIWGLDDFAQISEAATTHIFFHRTYCNHLREHIRRIDDIIELQAVQYGMTLLDADLQVSMDALLGIMSNA